MPQRLSDIVPSELSLVRRGAVRRPFLFMKADEEPFEVDESIAKALAEPADGEQEWLAKTLGDEAEPEQIAAAAAAYRLMKSAEFNGYHGLAEALPFEKRDFTAEQRRQLASEGKALPDGSYPIETRADIRPALTLLQSGHGDTAAAKRLVMKRARELGATDLLPDSFDVRKEDEMPEGTGAAVPIKKDDGTWDLSNVPEDSRAAVEAVLKAHDDEVAELRKQAEAEQSKADEAIAIAKAEREQRELRDHVAKAEQLAKLPAKPDELGAALHAVAKAEADGHVPEGTVERLETVLKAADEAIRQGDLYSEIGSGRSVQKSDAETQIDAKAEEIRKSDTSLTKEQALARAYRENPDLVAQMREAQ